MLADRYRLVVWALREDPTQLKMGYPRDDDAWDGVYEAQQWLPVAVLELDTARFTVEVLCGCQVSIDPPLTPSHLLHRDPPKGVAILWTDGTVGGLSDRD